MIKAKLIKFLEKEGFELNFPDYSSNEEAIIEIIKEKNERLYPALILLLKLPFEYKSLLIHLDKSEIEILNKFILITNKILHLEKIDSTHLNKIIEDYKLKTKIEDKEIEHFRLIFNETINRKQYSQEGFINKQTTLRIKLDLNQALSKIFSPAKIRIMDKIFTHQSLTNTELKYYYRSIRPLIKAISNEDLTNYLKIIESTKKIS